MIFDARLTSDAFFDNPHAVYHQLRAEAPVYWSEAWAAWVLTRYDDSHAVVGNHAQFSSADRVTYLLDQLPQAQQAGAQSVREHYSRGLAHSDPPGHTRLRAMVQKVFTPRNIGKYRQTITQVTNDLLDAMQGEETADLVADFAYPLPAVIISTMLGVPREDIHLLRDWADAINGLFALGGKIDVAAIEAAKVSLNEMCAYLDVMVNTRKQSPTEDIIGILVREEDEQGRLTVGELVSTAVTLFVAGHETTTNLLANGLWLLLDHPDQLAKLRATPDLINNAIEEMLRYEPSVPRGWRITREAVTLRGKTIPAGAMVFPMFAAANRDPAHFPQPDVFDIQRDFGNKHLAFGYGIHYCVGAPLARLEASIALPILLERLPNLQRTDAPIVWKRDIAIRSMQRLPVTIA